MKSVSKIAMILLMSIILILLCLIIHETIKKSKNKNEEPKAAETFVLDMASNICENGYMRIFSDDNYTLNGIVEDIRTHYVYYIKDLQRKSGQYQEGGKYEFGYVHHAKVEKYFKNAIYFYRESHVTDIPSELRIAFEANNENELIAKYGHNLYEFVKDLNSEYKNDIEIIIYYNSSLADIKTTYDKLFLYAGYNTNNVTQAFGIGSGKRQFVYCDADPIDILNTIFSDPNNYTQNASDALKLNRHIRVNITNGQSITEPVFTNQLKRSFEDGY